MPWEERPGGKRGLCTWQGHNEIRDGEAPCLDSAPALAETLDPQMNEQHMTASALQQLNISADD